MPKTNPPNQLDHAHSSPPFLGALARLYWMMLGNAALSLITIGIALRGPERAWLADVAFWTVVASLVLVRYLDIAWLGGTTASGGPASLGAWRRYSWQLLLLALALWIAATHFEAVWTHAVTLAR